MLRKMYFFVLSLIETSGIPMHVALLCLDSTLPDRGSLSIIPKFYNWLAWLSVEKPGAKKTR